jgi:hypothetical protein
MEDSEQQLFLMGLVRHCCALNQGILVSIEMNGTGLIGLIGCQIDSSDQPLRQLLVGRQTGESEPELQEFLFAGELLAVLLD